VEFEWSLLQSLWFLERNNYSCPKRPSSPLASNAWQHLIKVNRRGGIFSGFFFLTWQNGIYYHNRLLFSTRCANKDVKSIQGNELQGIFIGDLRNWTIRLVLVECSVGDNSLLVIVLVE
jgi:hypothetical protein